MTDGVVQVLRHASTTEACPPLRSTFLPSDEVAARFAGWCRSDDAMMRHVFLLPILSLQYPSAEWRGTLVEKAQIDAYCRLGTALPSALSLQVLDSSMTNWTSLVDAPVLPIERTPAQLAIIELKALSGLINEELAPLLGVSRRGMQKWVAGEPISARRDQRLRALLEAVQDLNCGNPTDTRARLLRRSPGDVRPYDLLAEGRFEAAVDLALGRTRSLPPARESVDDLAAQLDRREDRVNTPPGRLNARLSGRVKK